jgi:hypothetical protein
VNIDAGILTGVAGALLATVSLIYARSQAHAQRRQVEEMQRQTDELRRAQHFETSHTLMKDAIAARQAWVAHFRKEWAPPTIQTALERPLELLDGNWEVLFRVRTYVEQLQEMFFARNADLVADDHWRAMHWLMRGFLARKSIASSLRVLLKWVGLPRSSQSSGANLRPVVAGKIPWADWSQSSPSR